MIGVPRRAALDPGRGGIAETPWGGLEVGAVDVEVTGDQGRDEAIELRDKLRLYVLAIGGTGGISLGLPYIPVTAGRLGGEARMVPVFSAGCTFVELFHLLLGTEGSLLFDLDCGRSARVNLSGDSTFKLWLYL
jgi:hypothetical protein